jgi:hypothetical protein
MKRSFVNDDHNPTNRVHTGTLASATPQKASAIGLCRRFAGIYATILFCLASMLLNLLFTHARMNSCNCFSCYLWPDARGGARATFAATCGHTASTMPVYRETGNHADSHKLR